MGEVEHIRNDGSVAGVITELNAMFARDEIAKLIVCFIRSDNTVGFAFCGTESTIEELGLLELGKIQALTTREVID